MSDERRRDSFQASTIFTSAVRALFLPLLDTSGDADGDTNTVRNNNRKFSTNSVSSLEEPLMPVDGQADKLKVQIVAAPRRETTPEFPGAVPTSNGGALPCLQPPSIAGFRPVSPTFKKGRFMVTEVEPESEDESNVPHIEAGSQGGERGSHIVTIGLADSVENADKAVARERSVGQDSPPKCQRIEIVVSPSGDGDGPDSPIADDAAVTFIPASPTVKRGRFNVTQMQVSRRSSCASDCQLDEALLAMESQQNQEPSTFLKPLKSILRRVTPIDTVNDTSKRDTNANEQKDLFEGCTNNDGQQPLSGTRVPFTPQQLECLLQEQPHKKSVRFSEATLERLSAARKARARERAARREAELQREVEEESQSWWLRRCPVVTKGHAWLLCFIVAGVLHGVLFHYTVAALSAAQREFNLNTKNTGRVLAGVDVAHVVVAVLVCYGGRRLRCERLVGVSMALMVASVLTSVLPHFLFGPWGREQASLEIYPTGNSSQSDLQLTAMTCASDGAACGEGRDGRGVLVLLMASHFFLGAALTIFFAVSASPRIDYVINRINTPICYGAGLMLRVLGPALGYVLGATVMPALQPPPHPILPGDRWWPLFGVAGMMVACVAVSLLLPHHTIAAALTSLMRRRCKAASECSRPQDEARHSLKEFYDKLKQVLRCRVWLVHLFTSATLTLAVASYWDLRPTYIHQLFRKNNKDANFFTGLSSLMSVALSVGMGGVAVVCTRPRARLLLVFQVILTLCGGAAYIGLIFVGCPKLEVSGMMNGSRPLCSASCECSDRFTPMCGEDGATLYYSPCHAACTHANTSASPTVYHQCGCVLANAPSALANQSPDEPSTTTNPQPTVSSAAGGVGALGGSGVDGFCPQSCESDFFSYMALLVLTLSIHGANRVRNSVLVIRVVCKGAEAVAVMILGAVCLACIVSAPYIMAAVLGSACVVWESLCGSSDHCWLYDTDQLRLQLHLVPAVLVLVGTAGDVLVCLVWWRAGWEEYPDIPKDTAERRRSLDKDEARPLKARNHDLKI